jgi:hypothetical protein
MTTILSVIPAQNPFNKGKLQWISAILLSDIMALIMHSSSIFSIGLSIKCLSKFWRDILFITCIIF